MAENDTTITNLQKSVAQLSEKLDKISARLEEQRSHLSSVQAQLDDLRQGDDPRAERAEIARRQQELSQTAGLLRPKLEELEEQVGLLPVLQDRLQQLRSDFQLLRASAEGFDGSLGQHVGDLVRRIEAVEGQILRLAEVQETLELQTALLSKEAETGATQLRADRDLFDGHIELGDRVDQLSAQLRNLAQQVAQQPHADLSRPADTKHLTAMVIELSDSLRELERRLDQCVEGTTVMRPAGQVDDGEPWSEQISSVQQRVVQADELAAQFEHRAAALESRQTLLEQSKAGLVAQVQETDRGLSALAEEMRALVAARADVVSTVPDSRIDVLDGGLEAMQGQLAEQSARLDKLVQAESNLATRLEATAAGALDAAQGIERLRDDQRKLSELVERLDATISDDREANSDLENRVAVLDMAQKEAAKSTEGLGLQQTRHEVEYQALRKRVRLRSILGLLMLSLTAGGLAYLSQRNMVDADRPQQLAQVEATAERIVATTRSDIGRAIAELRRELAVLGDSLAELKRSVDALDSATLRALPGQFDRLLTTVETLAEQDRQRNQEIVALKAAQAGAPGLLRGAASELEEMARSDSPEQLGGATPAAGKRSPRTGPDRSNGIPGDLVNSADSKAPRKPETPPRREVGPASDGKTSADRSPARPAGRKAPEAPVAKAESAPAAEGRQWAQAQKQRRYTLQLGGFHRRQSLESFVRRHRIAQGSAVYRTQHQGRTWYVLFYGTFERVHHAVAATRRLPASVAAQKPWVRRLPRSGILEPL